MSALTRAWNHVLDRMRQVYSSKDEAELLAVIPMIIRKIHRSISDLLPNIKNEIIVVYYLSTSDQVSTTWCIIKVPLIPRSTRSYKVIPNIEIR